VAHVQPGTPTGSFSSTCDLLGAPFVSWEGNCTVAGTLPPRRSVAVVRGDVVSSQSDGYEAACSSAAVGSVVVVLE
jgi:hypothetical protein